MTFHIIYTPHSVKYLLFFVSSLLEYTPFRYCLVSNGCLPAERVRLRMFAATHERLSYYCYPTHQMDLHGKVLSHLHARNQEPYFCFMDSDIFATSKLDGLLNRLKENELAGLFSAMPIWVKKKEYQGHRNFRSLLGMVNQDEEGNCLGSTYFAIYKEEMLRPLIQQYGLCFEETPRNRLPVEVQQLLSAMGWEQRFFDTGKVINLLLHRFGAKLKNVELQELCHIGGTSYETTYQKRLKTPKHKLKSMLRQIMPPAVLAAVQKKRQIRHFQKRYRGVSKEEYQFNFNQRLLHRGPCRKHFLALFEALTAKKKVPAPPVFDDSEITARLAAVHLAYIENFKKFHT